MENSVIPRHTEKKIISDLDNIIQHDKKGKVNLDDYVSDDMGSCFDFAMLYEASDELRDFIQDKRRNGVKIDIQEDSIDVL